MELFDIFLNPNALLVPDKINAKDLLDGRLNNK
jgi:hypothetical protein